MPRRSTIFTLPDVVREGLDQQLRANAYADYLGLVEWLESQGHKISKSALHRYGRAFQRSDAVAGVGSARTLEAGHDLKGQAKINPASQLYILAEMARDLSVMAAELALAAETPSKNSGG